VIRGVLGAMLIAVGTLLRVTARFELARVGINDAELGATILPKRWATDGPYRFLRHPLYVGHLVTIAGIGVLALGYAGVFLALPALPFYQLRIAQENKLRKENP
jgi:protein-S-isoprenylcysteine O-methyltransferase Ste14